MKGVIKKMIQTYAKGKLIPSPIPTKRLIGHAITTDGLDIKFEFEVPVTADEDNIISKMSETFFEMFQMFYEEAELIGTAQA